MTEFERVFSQNDEEAKKYTIMINGDDLKWQEPLGTFVGSLADHVEFHDNAQTGNKEIRWKQEYLSVRVKHEAFLMDDYNTGKLIEGYWMRASGDSSKHGVMFWNYEKYGTTSNSGGVQLTIPPAATEEIPLYVLTGTQSGGLSWSEYNSMNIVLQGSMDDIFEIYIDPAAPKQKKLRVRSEYDGSVNRYHYISLDDTGKIQADYLNAVSPQELMIWTKTPQIHALLQNPATVEGKTYFLSGDATNGLSWKEPDINATFVGSLADHVEFHDNAQTGDKEIRWKEEYAPLKYAGTMFILQEKNTNKFTDIP